MRMLDGLKAKTHIADRAVRAAGVRMLDFEVLRHAARHDGDTSQGSILP